MHNTESRRVFLAQVLAPVVGVIAGAVAIPIGLAAFAAGVTGGGLDAYLVAVVIFGGGYGVVQRGVHHTMDRVFYASIILIAIGTAYTLFVLHPPPSMFVQMTNG